MRKCELSDAGFSAMCTSRRFYRVSTEAEARVYRRDHVGDICPGKSGARCTGHMLFFTTIPAGLVRRSRQRRLRATRRGAARSHEEAEETGEGPRTRALTRSVARVNAANGRTVTAVYTHHPRVVCVRCASARAPPCHGVTVPPLPSASSSCGSKKATYCIFAPGHFISRGSERGPPVFSPTFHRPRVPCRGETLRVRPRGTDSDETGRNERAGGNIPVD